MSLVVRLHNWVRSVDADNTKCVRKQTRTSDSRDARDTELHKLQGRPHGTRLGLTSSERARLRRQGGPREVSATETTCLAQVIAFERSATLFRRTNLRTSGARAVVRRLDDEG